MPDMEPVIQSQIIDDELEKFFSCNNSWSILVNGQHDGADKALLHHFAGAKLVREILHANAFAVVLEELVISSMEVPHHGRVIGSDCGNQEITKVDMIICWYITIYVYHYWLNLLIAMIVLQQQIKSIFDFINAQLTVSISIHRTEDFSDELILFFIQQCGCNDSQTRFFESEFVFFLFACIQIYVVLSKRQQILNMFDCSPVTQQVTLKIHEDALYPFTIDSVVCIPSSTHVFLVQVAFIQKPFYEFFGIVVWNRFEALFFKDMCFSLSIMSYIVDQLLFMIDFEWHLPS